MNDIKSSNSKMKSLARKIKFLIKSANDKYKKILAEYNFGNQIIFCIEKR